MDEDWDEHVQKLIHVLAAICYGIWVTSRYLQDKNSLNILYWAIFEIVDQVFLAQKRAISYTKNGL